jgi:hypothetical protein
MKPEASLFKNLEMDDIDALDWFAAMESEIGLRGIEKEQKEIRTVQGRADYGLRIDSIHKGRNNETAPNRT